MVKDFKWFYKKDQYGGYAATQIRIVPYGQGKRGTRYQKMTPMHRIILSAPLDRLVDHINQDKLDNRCSNLRLADYKMNIINRGKQRNNSSGYTGVQYRKDRNKWFALIGNDGKYRRLGSFDTPEEAHQAYQVARTERDKELS